MNGISRYRGMYFTVLIVAAITMASYLGLLRHGQGWMYDRFVNTLPHVFSESSQVVIVELAAHEPPPDEADWTLLLETIQSLGARQVVFSGLPAGVGPAFIDQVLDYDNIILGRTPAGQEIDANSMALDEWPARLDAAGIPFGLLVPPRAEFGISRLAQTRLPHATAWLPSLAVAAAQANAPDTPLPRQQEFLVNFNDGRDRLPKVSAGRVLANALIPEIVAGRAVLVGMAPAAGVPGVHAPVTYDTEPLSLLEFQGYALDTLLAGKTIHATGPLTLLSLLLITALASLFVYQWLDVRSGGWYTLVMLAVYWVSGWGQLHYLQLWPPVFELSLSQVLLYLLFARIKATTNESALRKLIADNSGQFHNTAGPANFYDAPEHWTQVITLVDQVLHLRRLIFLEKVEGDHRVREVRALNCSIDAIDERRRDYERTPYSTAIAEGGPILLEKSYLRPLEGEEEDQYLVPLVFAGEVLGFWAFGVAPEQQTAGERFLETVAVFANQISELLYHRRRWLEQQHAQASALLQSLRLEGGNPAYPQVRRFLELAQRRVAGLEAVFNSMDTAAIVYDLFGRVLHLNRRMENFMRSTNLPGYELTALDLLVRITNSDRRRARQLMREVVMENGEFHLPVTAPGSTTENFMLSVRAVSSADFRISATDTAAPFQISGLLFELVNVSQLKGVYAIKDEFVERFGQRMRRELSAILLAGDLLQENKLSQRNSARTRRVLREKIAAAVDMFRQARRYMQVKVAGPGLGVYPVDATTPVLSAMHALGEAAQARGIRFSTRLPEVVSLVNAAPDELDRLMQLLLDALLDDAAENTVIEIGVEERDDTVRYRLRNDGFGIPNERFQAYLFGGKNVVADEFKALHDAISCVDEWEGSIAANSEVGSGMAFDIELKAVI